MTKEESIIGCILGTAVGDALGLYYEGMSKRRQRKLSHDGLKYRFFFDKGMTSDDTEHTCMVAQALVASAGDVGRFVNSLGWKFRFWLLGLPAGIGYATLRGILKLWMGFSPHGSGVFSAGNGPAMRNALMGVCYGEDRSKLRGLVRASTRITHTDPKAEVGALAVALAAHVATERGVLSPQGYYRQLQALLGEDSQEFFALIERAIESVNANETTERFAEKLGLSKGVSGYTYHTVPVVLHCWFRHPKDYPSAMEEIIRCGGDTDTTAAILGAIIGAGVGKEGIPKEWVDGLWEWPRSVQWMEKLGNRLAEVVSDNIPRKPLPLPVYGVLLRNIFFILVILAHVIRRSLPPY